MSAQHHYVSKFHLRQFLDLDSLTQHDPWLWQGRIFDGTVKRRAPKNVGTERLLFDGPGGLGDRDATLEAFLAEQVEGPAAVAIKEFCARPVGKGCELPAALMRYLGWAAARSLPMQQLFSDWAKAGTQDAQEGLSEAPPLELIAAKDVERELAMVHPTFGPRIWPRETDFNGLIREGWTPDYNNPANFLESVHIQAFYFQSRFFPRLRWFTLRPPQDEFFVIADRAVGWAAEGYLEAPPSCLRDPSAYVLAPLSRDLVLVGRNATTPWKVTPSQINSVIACWAHDWIAGPTQSVVENALASRRLAFSEKSQ